MKRLRTALVVALGVSVPAVAAAQRPGPAPAPADDAKPAPADGEGQEVELEDDPPPDDMEGTSENPDAPRLVGGEEVPTGPQAPAVKRTGYPLEELLRPLTLPAVMTEVGLDLRSTFGNFDAEIGLRARYGITRQWQLGLRYLIGGLYDDPASVGDDAVKFNTGKAVGLDVTYLVFDWLAGHVTIPVYVDPLAVAVTLGAPMKFRLNDKLAIVALDDFIDIRISNFVPSLTHESVNEGNVILDETNSTRARGNLHLRAGVIYQHKPDLALRGEFRQTFEDFGDNDNATALDASVQYSPSPKMDVTGRIGFERLDDAVDSFGLLVAAAYRI